MKDWQNEASPESEGFLAYEQDINVGWATMYVLVKDDRVVSQRVETLDPASSVERIPNFTGLSVESLRASGWKPASYRQLYRMWFWYQEYLERAKNAQLVS